MKQSKLFTKTQRTLIKDEVSINANLLIRAGFIDKLMAGVYTLLPLGFRVVKNIENIIRQEMDAMGGQEIFMPTLQPKENWVKTGRWDTMDDLYKVEDSSGREMALGPTHEEVVVPLVRKFVQSYQDLPVYIYQFQNKFRMELRSKSGILRGREFMMKDFYSFHLLEEDLLDYYEKMKSAYFKVFNRAGLKEHTHLTFASGGSFSKYSHEFQTVTLAGEDIIYICSQCGMAVNKEIKEETKACLQCKSAEFTIEKSIEVGNIFILKSKFSNPFDFTVRDKSGDNKEILMGCYGIGLGRLMGTAVEVHHDDKGIIWPKEISPFQVHLLSFKKNEEAEKLYHSLQEKNIEVLYDDRNISAGEKFADADLIGIPYRVVVSDKSLAAGGVEIKKRDEEKGRIVSESELLQMIWK